MIEHNTEIKTADGVMATFITHPETNGPHPVILFLMDAPGKREELHDMARRISATGYYVMLPNLYYRDVPSFTVHREDPGSREYMFSLMANLTNALVAADAAAMIEYAASDSTADASRVGVTGYCMSGPFALWIAAEFPEIVKSAASIHGVRLAVDAEDSPHTRAADMAGEILVMAAEHDDCVDAHITIGWLRLSRLRGLTLITNGLRKPIMALFSRSEHCSISWRLKGTGNCCTGFLSAR